MNRVLYWIDIRPVFLEVLPGIGSIVLVTIFLSLLFLKLERHFLKQLLGGGVLVLTGIVLFLQGVNIGFVPTAQALAEHMGKQGALKWLLIPLSCILAFMVTRAEPGVKILSSQVERTTGGSIPARMILNAICFGVAFFTALGIFRILMGFPIIYVLIPSYLLALAMMFKCSPLFIGIAFDSSTVSTGPMIITFFMALAIGLSMTLEGRDPFRDGFGLVALVAVAPIISIIFVGTLHRSTSKKGADFNDRQ